MPNPLGNITRVSDEMIDPISTGNIPEAKIVCMGKVEKIFGTGDIEEIDVLLRYTQFPIELWLEVMNSFMERQDSINTVIKKMNQ